VALVKSVEATGKTLEEARAAALHELQATAEEVTFEVIEEPKKLLGFLGTAGEFRVRATLADPGEEPMPLAEALHEQPHQAAPEAAPEGPAAALAPVPPAVQAAAERARAFLAETTRLMGLDAEVVVRGYEQGEVDLEIQGQSLALLIGRHGSTLDALQLLAAVVANTGTDGGPRILVDAEEYRERRRETLRKMALAHAEKAKQRGQEVVLPDLKPFERRVIHLTLKDDPDVETYSEGEGEDRCLVISPKNG
jgi:spoIIIJ-associated protein